MGPNPKGLCPYTKGKFGHSDRHTYRKKDVKKQRRWQSQARAGLRPPEARAQAWDRSSVTASEGTGHADTLILDFQL